MNNREKERDDGVWKSVVILLVILLLCGIGYIVKVSLDLDEVNTQLRVAMTEKDSLLKELTAMRDSYDKCIADGDAMSQELAAERDKVSKLMYQLRKCKGVSLEPYKIKIAELQAKLKQLMDENEVLAFKYDSIYKLLRVFQMAEEVQPEIDTIPLEEPVIEAPKKEVTFSISDIRIKGYRSKPSGNKEMKKAKKVNVLEVSFSITPNSSEDEGATEAPAEGEEEEEGKELTYYVKITDSKGKILGGSTATLGGTVDEDGNDAGDGRSEQYSLLVSESYNGESISSTTRMNVSKLVKGQYSVVIFDQKGQTKGNASFNLE